MDLWTLIAQRPCQVCRSFKPARHVRVVDDPAAPPLYSRKFGKRRLRNFLDSWRSGCPGCGIVIGALEVWQPGWTKDPVNEDESIELRLNKSSLCMWHWKDDSAHGLLYLIQPQGLYERFRILKRSTFIVVDWQYIWQHLGP